MKYILRSIRSNLSRALLCPRFLLCVAISLVIQLMGVWDIIAMEGLNVTYLFFWLMQLGTFQILLLCVPAMVYSDSFLEDLKGSVIRFSVQRSGVFKYLFAKYIATLLSGFAVMTVSFLIFLAALCICFPLDDYGTVMNIVDIVSGSYSQLIVDKKSFLYLFTNIVHQGICGAFYAGMALACSTFIDNSFVVIAAPILLGQWSGTLRNLTGMKYSLMDIQFGTTELTGTLESSRAALVLFIPLITICGILFIWNGKRRVYEAL